jgi:hypothetical protein
MKKGIPDNSDKQENLSSQVKKPVDCKDSTGPTRVDVDGYEIRIRDHLETYWFEWFGDWSITNLENGEVLLRSSGVDQSGLQGALNKIWSLNLTLLSVTSKDK